MHPHEPFNREARKEQPQRKLRNLGLKGWNVFAIFAGVLCALCGQELLIAAPANNAPAPELDVPYQLPSPREPAWWRASSPDVHSCE